MQWPYPYDKPSSIQALPPAALLASPSIARHVRHPRLLTMTREECKSERSPISRRTAEPRHGAAGAMTTERARVLVAGHDFGD